MTRSAKKPRLWFVILTLLTFVGACDLTSRRGRQARHCRWNLVVSRWWHKWENESLFRKEHASGRRARAESCWRILTHTRHPYLWESFQMVVYSCCISCPSMLGSPTWTVLLKGWAVNWECTPLLTISQRLPILVSRHRCWWVSCVPES